MTLDAAVRFTAAMRVVAVAAWTMLAVLSLLPGHQRPHTGLSGNLEHALAYGLTSVVTRLGFAHRRTRWQLVAFSAAAAFFEVCQIWIPGRSPGIDNWLSSTVGALAGIVPAREIAHRLGLDRRRLTGSRR